jgi:hypothetical protein
MITCIAIMIPDYFQCIEAQQNMKFSSSLNLIYAVKIYSLCNYDPAASPPYPILSGPLSLGFIATFHSYTTQPQNENLFTTFGNSFALL